MGFVFKGNERLKKPRIFLNKSFWAVLSVYLGENLKRGSKGSVELPKFKNEALQHADLGSEVRKFYLQITEFKTIPGEDAPRTPYRVRGPTSAVRISNPPTLKSYSYSRVITE